MYSTHEAKLDIPSLPVSTWHGHLVPALTSVPLISIGQLCDLGCEVNFNASTATVPFNNQLVMLGHRAPKSRLWHFDLSRPLAQTNAVLHAITDITIFDSVSIAKYCNGAASTATPADLVEFAHAALFCPALSMLETALLKSFLPAIPGLSVALLHKHPPQSLAMVKGHMDQLRQNQRSTKAKPKQKIKSKPLELPNDTFPKPSDTKGGSRSQCYFAAIIEPT